MLGKAFRGELVAQDPNDEPADVMLARARSESAGVATDGKMRPKHERPAYRKLAQQ
jgi:type I restriction enzyme, S subunit